jgi:alkanesulfonate monooxygenase SsuD/methylene tetrahydromethanopterin reductase-like flavin-dependent oxidoreductase (luciferase family)
VVTAIDGPDAEGTRAMVKVILQIYPVIRAENEAERIALRPIGRNRERNRDAIQGTVDIARACESLGVWGMSQIEHHFHSEGYEVAPAPGIMNALWAAHTERLHIGQLGYVMSNQNPIRVAEETAVLDNITNGRLFVGFARGYQDRWTNVFGQHLGSRATHSDGSADDLKNRDIYREQVQMVLDCWTQESVEHNTDLWQIPYPYDEGIEWWMTESTARIGAPGEIGADGRIHRVSVVPAPLQDPHPPVFVPSSGSVDTVEYCARMGFTCVHVVGDARSAEVGKRYTEVARAAGRDIAHGQGQGVQRYTQIGPTYEAAREQAAEYDADIYKNFWNPLYERIVDKEVTLTADSTLEEVVDEIEKADAFTLGTVDQIREQLVAYWEQLPAEYIVLTWHYAQQPKESVIEQLETFMREIKPALDDLTPYDMPED